MCAVCAPRSHGRPVRLSAYVWIIMHSIDKLLSLHIQCNWVFKHWRWNTKCGLFEICIFFRTDIRAVAVALLFGLFLLISFDIVIVIIVCTCILFRSSSFFFKFRTCHLHILKHIQCDINVFIVFIVISVGDVVPFMYKHIKLHLHSSKNHNTKMCIDKKNTRKTK